MKKLLFFMVLNMAVFVSVSAQKPHNQLTSNLSSISQLRSSNQQIIEQAVKNGVFIIQQSYELADSAGGRFGLNHRRAFGIDYSLAVKVRNGYLVSQRTIHPWNFNPKYDKYRDKYSPVLFSSTYSEIEISASFTEIDLRNDSVKEIVPELLYFHKSLQLFQDGFLLGGKVGKNEGWMVWFTKKKGLDLSKTTDLNLNVVKEEVFVSDSQENDSFMFQVDSLTTNDEIMGGIFIVPEIVSIGRIELKLCGVANRSSNGWVLSCPFINNKILSGLSEENDDVLGGHETPTSTLQELTPNHKDDELLDIKKDKSKKRKK